MKLSLTPPWFDGSVHSTTMLSRRNHHCVDSEIWPKKWDDMVGAIIETCFLEWGQDIIYKPGARRHRIEDIIAIHITPAHSPLASPLNTALLKQHTTCFFYHLPVLFSYLPLSQPLASSVSNRQREQHFHSASYLAALMAWAWPALFLQSLTSSKARTPM